MGFLKVIIVILKKNQDANLHNIFDLKYMLGVKTVCFVKLHLFDSLYLIYAVFTMYGSAHLTLT